MTDFLVASYARHEILMRQPFCPESKSHVVPQYLLEETDQSDRRTVRFLGWCREHRHVLVIDLADLPD